MSEIGNRRGRIAVVFDIDGTLLPPPSLELRLVAHLALKGEMQFGAVGKWLRTVVPQMLRMSRGSAELSARPPMLDENKTYLKGVRVSAVEEWIAREFAEVEFFSEALAIVDWHQRRGHGIVLISGTPGPLARAVGRLLADGQEIHICATELECEHGRWTGRVDGEPICGPAKERALVRMAAERHFDLNRSYAYADSMKDRWLLAAVGHPIAVNAGSRLARHGRRCGWRLANWNERVCIPALTKGDEVFDAENSGRVFAEKVSWK
jgi:HAD superfamily hydrolase (TIGR01490 family)